MNPPTKKFPINSDDPFVKFAAQTISDSMRSILQLRDIASNISETSARGLLASYIRGTAGVILGALTIALDALDAYENSGDKPQ